MIEAKLHKAYPAERDAAAFQLNVEFVAGAGVTALFGPSGAGKTMILDCIAGFQKPDAGRVSIDGTVLFDRSKGIDIPPSHRGCGYVFQNYALFPNMTVRENLLFAVSRFSSEEQQRRVDHALKSFRLGDVGGRRPHQLSGGQKQRCSIARALAAEPRLLLLDEPARGLDAPLREELYEVIRQIKNDFQTPILLVTHDLSECFELASEMIVVDKGALVRLGSPQEISNQPHTLDLAKLLGIFNILDAEVRELKGTGTGSILSFAGGHFVGPELPGRSVGDRLHVLVRPDELRLGPWNGTPDPTGVVATLERAVEAPDYVRMDFDNGLRAAVSKDVFKTEGHNKSWWIRFPDKDLRVL
jgi:molybdate transport system ATP-binding protein